MNRIIFITILGVFFLLFFLLNKYVVSRGLLAIDSLKFQKIFQWTYWLLVLSFFVGQFLERGNPHFITQIISGIGSTWLAWFFYLLLFVVLIDIVRLIDHFIPFIPQNIIPNISNKLLTFVFVFISTFSIVMFGFFNARNPIVKNVSITVDKHLSKNLKIAVVSDLHIGAIVSNGKIKKLVTEINELQPDLVLIVGDLVDHNPKFAIKNEVGKQFLNLNPLLGIYAVTGNHEYIGEAEMSIEYLSQFGIKYLRDSVIKVNDEFYIAGREDKQKQFLTKKNRKNLTELLTNLDASLPLILMDHQPVEYQNAVAHKVDLMLSGHTHKGQMWPMNFITNKVFDNHYGLMKKGNSWFYTSNGFGTWGPPIRVGNRPEIVVIEMQTKK